MFSARLNAAIGSLIDAHAQELGEDGLEGVEEVVGDMLDGENYKEWEALTEALGFDVVTKAIKAKFL